MHSHDHASPESDSLRPKGARIDERPDAQLMEAAAAGRSDVLGAEGLLRMQRAVGNAGMATLMDDAPSVKDVTSRSGQPLDGATRAEMEGRLGADFSDVRVHTDGDAHRSAQSVNAHAYTVGSNVVFQRDLYDPGSHAGKTMLAHELTHVIQQRTGPVDGTPAAGGIKLSDPSDRFEREAASNADRVMSQPTPTAQTSVIGAGGATVQRHEDGELQGAFVQRQDAPEEEEVQGSFVQRQDAPEEEEVQGSFVQRDVAQREEGEEEQD